MALLPYGIITETKTFIQWLQDLKRRRMHTLAIKQTDEMAKMLDSIYKTFWETEPWHRHKWNEVNKNKIGSSLDNFRNPKKGQCPKFAQVNPNHQPVDSFNC